MVIGTCVLRTIYFMSEQKWVCFGCVNKSGYILGVRISGYIVSVIVVFRQ